MNKGDLSTSITATLAKPPSFHHPAQGSLFQSLLSQSILDTATTVILRKTVRPPHSSAQLPLAPFHLPFIWGQSVRQSLPIRSLFLPPLLCSNPLGSRKFPLVNKVPSCALAWSSPDDLGLSPTPQDGVLRPVPHFWLHQALLIPLRRCSFHLCYHNRMYFNS